MQCNATRRADPFEMPAVDATYAPSMRAHARRALAGLCWALVQAALHGVRVFLYLYSHLWAGDLALTRHAWKLPLSWATHGCVQSADASIPPSQSRRRCGCSRLYIGTRSHSSSARSSAACPRRHSPMASRRSPSRCASTGRRLRARACRSGRKARPVLRELGGRRSMRAQAAALCRLGSRSRRCSTTGPRPVISGRRFSEVPLSAPLGPEGFSDSAWRDRSSSDLRRIIEHGRSDSRRTVLAAARQHGPPSSESHESEPAGDLTQESTRGLAWYSESSRSHGVRVQLNIDKAHARGKY